jgi:translation initiation factor IF-3
MSSAAVLSQRKNILANINDLKEVRTISKDRTLINGEIRDRELRVIASNGEQLGILSKREALEEAEKKNLDLVLISPRANPPVAKIMDYGKYRYDKQKKEKENRKKQKNMQVKEIRLSTFIEDHDIEVKAKAASKFLKNGDKVKVSLRFRGRERDYKDRGFEVMNRFADVVSDVAEVEKKPKFEGRSLTMFVAPKPDKK